jgi:CHAD domain-containing protein
MNSGVPMAYVLQTNEQPLKGLRRIAVEQVDQAMAVLTNNQLQRDAAVHQARQHCKKIRALLQLLKLGDSQTELSKVENAFIRDAAAKLAHVRDADAVLETFDDFRKYSAKVVSRRVLREARQVLTQRRESIHGDSRVDNWIEGFIADMTVVRNRVNSWPLELGQASDLMLGFARVHQRGRQAMKACRQSPTDETYHDWRKWSKYQFYQSLLLEPYLKDSLQSRVHKLKRLGKFLGIDHDLAVLRHDLLQAPDFSPVRQLVNFGELLRVIDHRRQQLQSRSLRIGKRAYGKGITSRLRLPS